LHARETGTSCSAFSASTIRYTLTANQSPGEEGRGSFEQVALLLKTLDLASQIAQLLALGRGQPVVAFSPI